MRSRRERREIRRGIGTMPSRTHATDRHGHHRDRPDETDQPKHPHGARTTIACHMRRIGRNSPPSLPGSRSSDGDRNQAEQDRTAEPSTPTSWTPNASGDYPIRTLNSSRSCSTRRISRDRAWPSPRPPTLRTWATIHQFLPDRLRATRPDHRLAVRPPARPRHAVLVDWGATVSTSSPVFAWDARSATPRTFRVEAGLDGLWPPGRRTVSPRPAGLTRPDLQAWCTPTGGPGAPRPQV